MSEDNAAMAEAILEVAKQLSNLGNSSATSDQAFGAIENLAQAVGMISVTK